MKPFRTLRIELEEGVGYLTLDAAARFNTLHTGCLEELRQAFRELEENPGVRCIVLSGGEGESFAVGANIAEMKDFGPLQALEFSELGQGLFAQMEEGDTPIVGALNGIAMGGGVDLALSCDIRLASDRLKMAHPGATLGIITGFCGTQKLPRLLGRSHALEVFMTSATYGADEALRLNLVDRVIPHGDFWPAVKSFARQVASRSPAALSYAKKLVNASEDVDLKNGQLLELGAFSALISDELPRRRMTEFFRR